MNEKELHSLIDALLEEEISEADFLRLEAEMLVNREARQAYYDRAELSVLLATEAEESKKGGKPERPEKVIAMKRWLIAGAGVAAAVAVWASLWKDDAEPEIARSEETIASGFAVLGEHDGAEWDGLSLARGDLLPQGVLTLNSGTAQLELFSGVTVIVSGEAEFELISPMEMIVAKGELRAHVPEVASGFRVRTQLGDVVDLGTEFAVSVTPDHADVHVLDGEVEFHPPSREGKLITRHRSVRWNTEGAESELPFDASSHREIAAVSGSLAEVRRERREIWLRQVEERKKDPRMLVYLPLLEDESARVVSNTAEESGDGIVVRAERVSDRWEHASSALDFSPAGSRVRMSIPGEHRSLTFYCWARIDSLDRLYNSLFLTDGHELNEPHWQIMNDGRLFFSVKAHEKKGRGNPDKHIVFSPPFWNPSMSGKWFQLVTVFDAERATVAHYVNGEKIHEEQIDEGKRVDKVRIGAASVGNWAEPKRRDPGFAVRNLNGAIDEFAIFRGALSAEEIAELYQTGKP